MDLQSICLKTIEITKQVGQFIREEREKFTTDTVAAKGKNDFVTHVDKGAEERLVKGLVDLIDGAGFITEEGTAGHSNEKYKWVIDPIDGTTNFIHGAPPYCISIGLLEDKKLVMGVVYEISKDECFYAWGDSPAYLNGKEIQVSSTPKVEGSLIATGFPYRYYDKMKKFMDTLEYFFHNSHGVRRLGSAAADLCYVACGRYDSFYEYGLKPYDMAGGAFIIKRAGGKVSNFQGEEDYLFGGEIIATNAYIYDEFQRVVDQFMG